MSHDDKVRELAKNYADAGRKVLADVDNYARPRRIEEHVPDLVVSRKVMLGGKEVVERVIIEVETEDTANDEHALSQDAEFDQHAKDYPHVTYKRVVI